MSRVLAQEDSSRPAGKQKPGQITSEAQGTLTGSAGAQERLYALVAPELRSLARRHLQGQESLELSPEEVASLALQAFAQSADFDLQSREQFFLFADQQAALIVRQAARGRTTDPNVLLGNARRDRSAAVLGQVIDEINEIDGNLARLLRYRFVLDLEPGEAAAVLNLPESKLQEQWKTAGALLEAKYRRGRSINLDTQQSDSYSGRDSLSPVHLPDPLDSVDPPSDLEALLAENEDLRTRLEAAEARVAELEALASIEPSRSRTQKAVGSLLHQPSLDSVPLLEGSSLEELFGQFRTNYGQWLRHFGAAEDAVSLDHIRRHDPKGVKKLEQKISKARKRERGETGTPRTSTLGQIVPKESDRGDQELAGKTGEEILADERLGRLFYGRLRRKLFGQ